jgi:peptidoglycan/LPS O-acetylase OafA/YrhL
MNKEAVQYLEEKHIKALDGVRGLAALLVLTAHILDILFQGTSIFGSTHQVAVLFAYSGMSLFFVLSGVVMEINYGGESNPAGRGGGLVAFIIKRIARLFPLYLVLLVCYNGISALLIKPLVGITYLTLTQSWVNNMQYTFAPAWSISTEFFF